MPGSPEEFEFWINPSCPQPHLLTADELFVDGVLLPLHHLHNSPPHPPQPDSHLSSTPPPSPSPSPSPPPPPPPMRSKKWKDIIFNKDKKDAELNIHIWPFSRSHSEGKCKARGSTTHGSSKANSAPCSRSNSQGGGEESSLSSSLKPAAVAKNRTGVQLGRSRPVWQLRRGGGGGKCSDKNGAKSCGMNGGTPRVINLNVNTCIGGDGGGGGGDGRLFRFKTLFSKKVY